MEQKFYTVREVAVITSKSPRAIRDFCATHSETVNKIDGVWVFSEKLMRQIKSGKIKITSNRKNLISKRDSKRVPKKLDLRVADVIETRFGVIKRKL